mmetsp:Transcript_8302/g.12696  ORF Transcript_8302/g.12696 Transcript_8302/m.12696 type:complete len:99 (-) Transcript_8302:454-750(-)
MTKDELLKFQEQVKEGMFSLEAKFDRAYKNNKSGSKQGRRQISSVPGANNPDISNSDGIQKMIDSSLQVIIDDQKAVWHRAEDAKTTVRRFKGDFQKM